MLFTFLLQQCTKIFKKKFWCYGNYQVFALPRPASNTPLFIMYWHSTYVYGYRLTHALPASCCTKTIIAFLQSIAYKFATSNQLILKLWSSIFSVISAQWLVPSYHCNHSLQLPCYYKKGSQRLTLLYTSIAYWPFSLTALHK